MVDFAQNLLKQANDQLKPKEKFKYYKQSLYELTIDNPVDALISIRTLHHLNDVTTLFKRYHEVLNNNGVLILDIPNYYHLKNKLIKNNRKKKT